MKKARPFLAISKLFVLFSYSFTMLSGKLGRKVWLQASKTVPFLISSRFYGMCNSKTPAAWTARVETQGGKNHAGL